MIFSSTLLKFFRWVPLCCYGQDRLLRQNGRTCNDKQTYQVLKRDPTPALQHKLNSKLLDLKKTDAIDIQRYNRLRYCVPQPPKFYGLPKLRPSLILWVPDLPTVQILDYRTETFD